MAFPSICGCIFAIQQKPNAHDVCPSFFAASAKIGTLYELAFLQCYFAALFFFFFSTSSRMYSCAKVEGLDVSLSFSISLRTAL